MKSSDEAFVEHCLTKVRLDAWHDPKASARPIVKKALINRWTIFENRNHRIVNQKLNRHFFTHFSAWYSSLGYRVHLDLFRPDDVIP